MRHRDPRVWPILGLTIAWGGTALLVSPAARVFGDPASLAAQLLGQLALWLLLAMVLATVRFGENQPLSSLWLRPFRWQSVAWAGGLVAAHIVILFPSTEWVRAAAGLGGYAQGMTQALSIPIWLRVVAVVTAGTVEEVLFRGYAVTRLLQLTGSKAVAIVVASALFAALHLPVWGPGPAVSFFLGGLAMTAFFTWRRDLLVMIVAHIAIDAWGLIVTPLYSTWWR